MPHRDGTPRDPRNRPETDPTLAVLLVEDHAAVARLIREFLRDHVTFRVTWVQTLAAALAHLHEGAVDLGLPIVEIDVDVGCGVWEGAKRGVAVRSSWRNSWINRASAAWSATNNTVSG